MYKNYFEAKKHLNKSRMEISFTSTMCTKGRMVLLFGFIKVNGVLGCIGRKYKGDDCLVITNYLASQLLYVNQCWEADIKSKNMR